MAKTIRTQDGILINYANVISIFPHEDTFEDTETGEDVHAFAILAELCENEEPAFLGTYDTGAEMERAMAALENWLTNKEENNIIGLFRMPQ